MVPPLEESEEGDRASFSRWEKRSVISSHFTELVLEITEIEILTFPLKKMSNGKSSDIIHSYHLSENILKQNHDSDADAIRKKALQEILK